MSREQDAPDPLHALCLADPVWAERYDGWDELGHGGSATVVRTRSRASDALVALKLFPRLDAEGRRRFQQEVRHNQLLASPFIVRTYSPFLRAGLSWIEMEWVDGPDLRHELERRAAAGEPCDTQAAGRIGAALARALHAAHAAGVIHRDVKPANVLLPRDGRPLAKLGDFGISRVLGATRITATGLIAGTPQFVAPEVVAGRPADARSDVYSLALTLFLLFSGNRFPYDVRADDPPASWLEAHARGTARRLRELLPEADAQVEALLQAALSKDPQQRPRADELAAALCARDDALWARPTGEQVTSLHPAAVPTVLHGAATPTRARQPLRAAAALACAAALGWGVGRTRGRPQSAASPPPVVAHGPAPSATPPSSPEPSVAPPEPTRNVAPLHASLAGSAEARLLVLANDGGRALPAFDVALVAADGQIARARCGQPLLADDELTLALDAFRPAPSAQARFVRVEVAFDDGTRTRLPLGAR